MEDGIMNLKKEFISLYDVSEENIRVFHAPGRVNLIGEHTDYNGGAVFPAALTMGTTVLIRRRKDNIMRMASKNMPVIVNVDVNSIEYRKEDNWANYPKGVALELRSAGYMVGGCDMLFSGDIPNGAGLSSSASIEVVAAFAITALFSPERKIDLIELAGLCQRAENKFVGVNCGIMDQFASAMGKKGNAIFLNCNTMRYKYVPVNLKGYSIVIANTNKRRGLTDSKYNERRSECELGLKQLKEVIPNIQCLGDVTLEQFEKYNSVISEDVIRKRVEHVIREKERVAKSVKALENNRIFTFGQLMFESHQSLKCLYEVTGVELDALVEETLKVDGVVGSRMTGAGFGGCTVSIVNEGSLHVFMNSVGKGYKKKTGIDADFYVSDIGEGVREIK